MFWHFCSTKSATATNWTLSLIDNESLMAPLPRPPAPTSPKRIGSGFDSAGSLPRSTRVDAKVDATPAEITPLFWMNLRREGSGVSEDTVGLVLIGWVMRVSGLGVWERWEINL